MGDHTPLGFVLIYVGEEWFSPRKSRLRGGIKVFTCGEKVYVGNRIYVGRVILPRKHPCLPT